MRIRSSLVAAVAILLHLTACAGIDPGSLGDVLSGTGPLDEATVASGLREALEVATGRSAETLSSVDGFLGNALLRIAVPESFDTAAGVLRDVGLGGKVDEFEIALNRAAERACGEARPVFWNEIKKLTIADAFAILEGEKDAATTYFRGRTETELRTRFLPVVGEKMEEVGVTRLYGELAEAYDALPFTTKPAIQLEDYVTDRALDGLFLTLADEEARIRDDPVARTTRLLRRVFGR